MLDYLSQLFSKQDFLSSDWLIFYAGLLVVFLAWLGRILWNKYFSKSKVTISNIFADNMPITDNAELVGRDDTLKLFQQAWESKNTRVLALVAAGGVGKSSVLNAWREKLANDPEHAPPRIYCWSFQNQGSINTETSSSDFFAHALQWLECETTKFASEHEKGRYLANRISQEKVLLVLDGVEVFQHIETATAGYVRDKAILALINTLAQNNPGLCLIATREAFNEKQIRRKGLATKDLFNLNDIAALHLLRRRKIKGSDESLLDCIHSYQGHAQSLMLLANYLRDYHKGDIRKLDRLPELKEWMGEETGNRLFAAYEAEWVKSPELTMLYLVSLFEKAVERETFDALIWALNQRQLAGFNSWLKPLLKAKACDRSINRLKKVSLLSSGLNRLDMHPATRQYFRHSFHYHFPSTWKQAHIELYEYYKALPEKELPDTLEEMRPLFHAVAHGCSAKLHQQAVNEVYLPRIRRGSSYITSELGAFSDELAVIANFFSQFWNQPATGLDKKTQAAAMNWAGFCLHALGRLSEAMEPMQTAVDNIASQKNWLDATKGASALSDLQLTFGRITDAVASGELSMIYADRSNIPPASAIFRATQATALHQAGKVDEALALFIEAEQRQQEFDPDNKWLSSLPGFRYCDLLLAQDKVNLNEIFKRAEQTLQVHFDLLSHATSKLTLGRAHHAQRNIPKAHDWLKQAVAGLRKSGHQEYLSHGLLARAALHRDSGKFNLAQQDLAEVWEIAETSEMRLHITDYHLEMARLLLASGEAEKAPKHIRTAETLINQTGYHRRDQELADLKNQLNP